MRILAVKHPGGPLFQCRPAARMNLSTGLTVAHRAPRDAMIPPRHPTTIPPPSGRASTPRQKRQVSSVHDPEARREAPPGPRDRYAPSEASHEPRRADPALSNVPSTMNGPRMYASGAPTSCMMSISWRRAWSASRTTLATVVDRGGEEKIAARANPAPRISAHDGGSRVDPAAVVAHVG